MAIEPIQPDTSELISEAIVNHEILINALNDQSQVNKHDILKLGKLWHASAYFEVAKSLLELAAQYENAGNTILVSENII
jgi:hypothetical protein